MPDASSNEFSISYRQNLASQISSEPDKSKRIGILTEAKRTLDYQLAKGEKSALLKGVDYASSQIRAQRELHGDAQGAMDKHFVSNEASLYKLFPLLRNLTGAVFGVGSDQVLDILSNSQTTAAFIVDYTESVSLFSRTLLEVGAYHKKTFGKFPTPEKMIDYFEDKNIHHIRRIMARNLSEQETAKVVALLQKGTDVWLKQNEATRVPVTEYMRFKSTLLDDEGKRFSWLGTQEHINKVLQAYEDGKIYVIKGDITNSHVLSRVAGIARQNGIDINVLYLSNVESYLSGHWDTCRNYSQGIQSLPTGDKAVILRTSWDINSRYPVPAEVAEKTTMAHILLDWHYNAQSYSDWERKAKLDETYLHNGWLREVTALESEGTIPKNGLSSLGLK